MRVPILTYHAVNIAGNDYADNDHVAFAADLRAITDLGLRIVPVHWIVDELLGRGAHDLTDCVALTCDDGSDFDYYDLVHPTHGPQRGLFNILGDFVAERGRTAQRDLHLTSFVIADPEARAQMDRQCLVGADWMRDTWWRAANDSPMFAIENHSWDHNHPCLAQPGPDGLVRGDFHAVATSAHAEFEIVKAQQFLTERLGATPTLFCYPFGHASEYLRSEWLPEHGERHGLAAAFGDGATPATRDSDRWNVPRYICGWHWKSPAELEAILREAR